MEAPVRPDEIDLGRVSTPGRAAALLHPLRLRLLAMAREPSSASEMARRLGLPRQRVNYHVRALERAGFLKAAGRQRKRNMIEQRYVASAHAFVLSPRILGPVGPDWRAIADTASADYLQALAEQVRDDLERASDEAAAQGKKISTLSIKSQFRFDGPDQRTRFAEALREAIVAVIARHTSPNLRESGRPGRGQAFRLVLACYPAPPAEGAGTAEEGGR